MEVLASTPSDGAGKSLDFNELSAVAAVDAMRGGDIKAEDYASALLRRVQLLESLNAFRTINRELVLSAARAADLARAKGSATHLLHGLPVPIKDSINSRDLPTSNGAFALRDFKSKDDAAIVKLLLAQGGILMGKTNLHELSYGWTTNTGVFGAVRNPYDVTRIPGGSSGGSAVAVAARMAPLSVAEDTWGSIRVPASMCGLAGFRPTFGRYPCEGMMPLTDEKFDQVGTLGRCVGDLALFDTAITGSATARAPDLKSVRIAIAPSFSLRDLDPEIERVMAEVLCKLRSAGIKWIVAELPGVVRASVAAMATIVAYEIAASIQVFLTSQGAGVSLDQILEQATVEMRAAFKSALPPMRPTIELYQSALAQRQRIQAAIKSYFEKNDIFALAFPSILTIPPRIGENQLTIRDRKVPFYSAMGRNTSIGACANMASLVLPAGVTSGSLPVGIEFAALPGCDRQLLALGQSLEATLGPMPPPRAI